MPNRRYTVRMAFDSAEAAQAWFEDVRAAGLTGRAGLRHLELGDVHPPGSEVPMMIGQNLEGRPAAWVVEPENVLEGDSEAEDAPGSS